MNDEWRAIPGFGSRYMINKDGDVVSMLNRHGKRRAPKLMRKRVGKDGTARVNLLINDNNERRCCRVMRLMAIAWIRELVDDEHAYPINGDRSDTRLENVGIRRASEAQMVPVLKVDLDGAVVKRYESILAAAAGEYVSVACIRYHLYGRAKNPFMGEYRFVREDGAV